MQALFGGSGAVDTFPRVLKQSMPELATWKTSEGMLAEPQQVNVRSLNSREPIRCLFVNTTQQPATIIWLDFCGREVAYGSVEPGERFEVSTFKTHPWIARSGGGDKSDRLMLDGKMAALPHRHNHMYRLAQTPLLPWSLQTHKHFPKAFRQLLSALLLEHFHRSKHAVQGQHTQQLTAPALSAFSQWCGGLFERWRQPQPQLDYGCLLDAMPRDLLVHILSFAAPAQRQCSSLHPHGHPDIPPLLLPGDPALRSQRCIKCGIDHGL